MQLNQRFNAAHFITQIEKSENAILGSLTIDGDLLLDSMLPALAYYKKNISYVKFLIIKNSVY
jgi:hypothetical protein